MRGLLEESFNRPYLDADQIASLDESTSILVRSFDYISILHHATDKLPSLFDQVADLPFLEEQLRGLPDQTASLRDATREAERAFHSFATVHNHTATVDRLIGTLQELDAGLQSKILLLGLETADAPAAIRRSVPTARQDANKQKQSTTTGPATEVIRSPGTSEARWRIRDHPFQAGFLTCMVFTVFVLSIVAYVVAKS
ncbi:hypothetical protein [Frankia sp. Cas3]|uniref:hypothetical protein n=1 Tax=Frankia sp. Cas3 TaxID=3073926 RepID=UPI002AD3A451|nr:hypothetical protein [Frankia sp. Cas3]